MKKPTLSFDMCEIQDYKTKEDRLGFKDCSLLKASLMITIAVALVEAVFLIMY